MQATMYLWEFEIKFHNQTAYLIWFTYLKLYTGVFEVLVEQLNSKQQLIIP